MSVPLDDWYKRCFRRLLVDMHIPDWDERFLSQLSADDYVRTILRGNITSTMLYCNSHVGHAFYPSEIGPVHAAVKGKDFVGQVVELCHQKNVAVVAYYSAIFNNEIFLQNSDWRIQPRGAPDIYEHSRYGVCCPNSGYRDFAVAQTEEICRAYPFQGMFFDMLFWPYICYCRHCQRRFREEEGGELPTTIDWHDPRWMAFQRARERWMDEMAGLLTAAVRRARPSMTVTHQMSPVLHDWRMAMPFSLTDHCDYTSGDFYGPAIQQSLVCKLFESLSIRKPFEFHTSRCTDLRDHVTMKSVVRMETQAALAPAHGSAFMFIDAVDPVGTLNQGVYERIDDIFSRFQPYEKHLGGSLVADIAIYASSESRFDFRENGTDVSVYSRQADNMAALFAVPHMDAAKGAARALQEVHIPYALVTPRDLAHLDDYRVVILPNVLVMSDEEIAAISDYLARGGAVYASGYSSLVQSDGLRRDDFGLADAFGVSAISAMDHSLAFVSPVDVKLRELVFPQEHIIHKGGFLSIEANSADVLATRTLCWYPENDGNVFRPSFSSIHSNPPGPTGDAPLITWHRYKKGLVCYSAGAIEAEPNDISRRLLVTLVRRLLGKPPQVEAIAPSFVEITAFKKSEENRLNISLVSLAEGDHPAPCAGAIRVRFDESIRPLAVRLLPAQADVPWSLIDGVVEFSFTDFKTFSMYEVAYAPVD